MLPRMGPELRCLAVRTQHDAKGNEKDEPRSTGWIRDSLGTEYMEPKMWPCNSDLNGS